MGPGVRRTAALLTAAALVGWPLLADGSVPGSCHGVTVTLAGTDGDDRLVGSRGRDVIAAGPGDDVVRALGGDDLVCGDAGSDRLLGGEGDDELDGGTDRRDVVDTEAYDWIGDELHGGPGDDRLQAGPVSPEGASDTVSWARSTAAVVVDLAAGSATGEGSDTLVGPWLTAVGSGHDDVLRGTDGADELRGSAGADRLEGRDGADMLVGFDLRDRQTETDGNVLAGGAGRDYLDGDAGPDVLLGGAGPDALRADGGRDRSHGGPGGDDLQDAYEPGGGQVVAGGPGRDVVGPDYFLRPGLRPGDLARGVEGSTDLRAGLLRAVHPDGLRVRVQLRGIETAWSPMSSARWTLLGSGGPDRLLAGQDERSVTIRGRGGDDELIGSFVRDLLDGGTGRDTLVRTPGGDVVRSVERRR